MPFNFNDSHYVLPSREGVISLPVWIALSDRVIVDAVYSFYGGDWHLLGNRLGRNGESERMGYSELNQIYSDLIKSTNIRWKYKNEVEKKD